MRRSKGGEYAGELRLSLIHYYQPLFVFLYFRYIFYPTLWFYSYQFQAFYFLYSDRLQWKQYISFKEN